MKKALVYIILATHIFFTGNIGIFFGGNTTPEADAASSTWDFSVLGDYTRSNTLALSISGSVMQLEQTTLAHTGVISNATTYNGAYDVVVDGIYAYMTNNTRDSVSILNISNPATPTFVSEIVNNAGTIRLDGAAGIVKDGNFLYVASQVSDALQIINVTNPALPTAAGQILNTPVTRRLDGARGITKSGNYVYIASDKADAISIIDVSVPTAPVWTGAFTQATNMNGARDIEVSGNYAYVTCYDRDAVSVINITNPAAPTYSTQLRQATRLNGAWGIEISGNYAYVSADLNASVMVINITNPLAPVETTNITGGSYSLTNPRDLLIDGNHLFISSFGLDAVNVANISNPAAPVYITKILHNVANPLLDGANGLFKVGNFIYTAVANSDALEILKFNYDTTSPFVSPVTTLNYGTEDITSFTETLGVGNQGTITYQISNNAGTTWYYYTGSAWATTVGGVANSSSASTINSNLTSFNVIAGTGVFSYKAFFTSNGNQKVELDTLSVVSSAVAPGGVGAGLSLWLRADKGTSTTVDGATLATWNDQSVGAFNATAVTAPIYRNSTGNQLNFNPIVDFDGATQYMQNLNNGSDSNSYFMVIVPDNTIDGTLAGNVPFGIDCLSGVLSSGTCGLAFAGMTLGAFTLSIADEVITHAIGASTNWRSAQTGVASYSVGKPMLLMANENAGATGTDIYEKGIKVDNEARNTYQTIANADYSIGRSLDAANPFWYNGKIAEVINFSGRVGDADRVKIESYLSLKYGITLKSGTQNYIASDGSTLMWSTSTAGAYTNSIFGIGRDDEQALSQIKSKSINDDGIITLEALTEGTNIAPSFVDIGNKEFLSVSDDMGSNTWTASGSPTGYHKLTREWRTQETGDVGTVQLDFDVADSDFDIPAPSLGVNYYFLYDSNNNNSLSDEVPSIMSNVSGSIWRISGVNLSNAQEFTIASQASVNNIPTNISLSNSSINENVGTGTTVGNLSSTDADMLDIHSYTFVAGAGSTHNGSFSIVGNQLKILEIPDYEIQNTYNIRIQTDDGNGGQYQKAFTITISDIGEVLTSVLDVETPGKYSVTSGSWTRTSTLPYEGLRSIESNNAGAANSQSCFEVSHTFTSTGGVDFYRNVSSDTTDFLQFYIDNVQQGAGWSGTVPWAQYVSGDIGAGTHIYKWCYIKDGATNAGTDNAFVDYITFPNRAGDIFVPNISSISFASGVLLPGGNHPLIINYSDTGSAINTGSANIELYKWDGVSSWGANIAATKINTGSITGSGANYTTSALSFGKYRYEFFISDNAGNTSSTGATFYIDEPEITISTGSIDIGSVNSFGNSFSPTVTVTVKTVGAGFNVIMNRTSSFVYSSENIASWNGFTGYGYDQSPYSSNISTIGTNQNIATQGISLNTNGLQNTYTYSIKIGALTDINQLAGDYLGNMSFGINLTY